MMLKVTTTLVLFLSITAGAEGMKNRAEQCGKIDDKMITKCDDYKQQCCNNLAIHGNNSHCSADKNGNNAKIYMNKCHMWQTRCSDRSVCIIRKKDNFCKNQNVSVIEPYCPTAECLAYPMLPAKDASHNINLPCRQPRHQPTSKVQQSHDRSLRSLLRMPTQKQSDCDRTNGSCGSISLEPRVCNRTENMQSPPRMSQCLQLSAVLLNFNHASDT